MTAFVIIVWATTCGILPIAYAGAGNETGARTWVFICPDESSYVVRTTESEAWVFGEHATLRLTAVAGARPLRYAQGEVELIIEGEHGMLSEPGKETFTCHNNRQRAVWEHAKFDGVDFRGVGNEPPWVLEIREMARIVLITAYGEKRVERPLPNPVTDQDRKITRWDAGDLKIEITAAICYDSMSGESFGSRVVIHWQGQVLTGCGRPLH
jgi:uncharacterized membrane protein